MSDAADAEEGSVTDVGVPQESVPDIVVDNNAPDDTPLEGDTTEEANEEGKENVEDDGEEKEGDEEEGEGDGEGNEDDAYMPRIQEEVEILQQELDDIKPAGGNIQYATLPESFSPEDFPITYRENTSKEILVNSYVDNFRRQYVNLYRDRKPLILCPLNECAIEKFVCSTLRPTKLSHKELYNWDGCSEFVAGYLNFAPLSSPTDLPERLLSPPTVLRIQMGTCFEYSNLLASLLIGVGYDAYVVSGYATRETCFMDESRSVCPLLVQKEIEKETEKVQVSKKYVIKPPKKLISSFENMMAERKVKEAEEEARKAHEEAIEEENERYKPAPDPIYGLRVHAWVLVLSGKRGVPESFFIEPLTGLSHPVNSANYLGIESLWNHVNYWVNMQDCSEGVSKLSYDLGDCTLWEYMLPSNDKPLYTIPDGGAGPEDEEDENPEEIEKHMELPPSWVEPIELSRRDFEMRCPQGKKVKFYKRAKLEKYAPYLLRDGLVTKLSIYEDREMKSLIEIREYFQNHKDKLEKRVINSTTGWVTEFFQPGRQDHLKEHTFQQANPGPENTRTSFFYHDARADGLWKREENPEEMTDHYKARPDHLAYRNALFGRRVKRFRPAGEQGGDLRPVEKIVVRFSRNIKVPIIDDVAERVFTISEDKISVTYHREADNIAANTREYIKPALTDDKSNVLVMTPETYFTFQVNPYAKDKKQVEIYQLLLDLIELETREIAAVRASEMESHRILEERAAEEVASMLEVELFDTLRNLKAKEHRRLLEQRIADEKSRKRDRELDYLAPFLAQLGVDGRVTKEQAFRLREACLSDLKHRLVDKANLIQARFERETTQLQKKQSWYQQNQISMSKEDEAEYLQYCHEAAFRITTLEVTLARHKQTAPHKYMDLERKIRADPRMAEYF